MRRRPKQLEEAPTLFEPAPGGAGGLLFTASEDGRDRPAGDRAGTSVPGTTDEPARVLDAVDEEDADIETLRRAQEIAARLALRRPRQDAATRRGLGELRSVPYRGTSSDIDLDATLDALVEHPVPASGDIVVRERVRTRRSVVLAVDVSGSMRGERVRTAAAAVGALVAELARDDLAVVAFWSDAVLLAPLGGHASAGEIMERLMRIPARGLTNVAFPLELAARQLTRLPSQEGRLLLLSDCVHNAGPDPRPAAAALPRVDVLLDTSGEHDLDVARDIARIGHGQVAVVRGHRDVPAALEALLDDARPAIPRPGAFVNERT